MTYLGCHLSIIHKLVMEQPSKVFFLKKINLISHPQLINRNPTFIKRGIEFSKFSQKGRFTFSP